MAENAVRVIFRGDGIVNGSIDARDLGHALVGLSGAFQVARDIALNYDDGPKTALKITNTGEGSFWVDITLVADQTLVQTVLDTLTSQQVDAAINLKEIVGYVIGGLLLIKLRKGRSVKKSEQLPNDPSKTTLTLDDGQTEVVSSDAWKVASNTKFQKAAKEAVKSLSSDGIDEIEIKPRDKDSDIPRVAIQKTEYRYFSSIDEGDDSAPPPRIEETVVSPLNAAFEEGKKWRLTDGESIFTAAIEDEDFEKAVLDGRVRCGIKDNFKVLMRVEQIVVPGKPVRTTRTIVQVLKHIAPPDQGEFRLP